jgi:hypothetical protein
MDILMQLLTSKHYDKVVDRVQFWMNTLDAADLAWMHDYKAKRDPNNWIELVKPPQGTVINPQILWHSVCRFYRYACDAGTVYVKVDDDICDIDTLERFIAFLDFRIDNDYFLVSANVLNNAILTHYHQRFGNLKTDRGIVGNESHDRLGLYNGEFAEYTHEQLLDDDLDRFRDNFPRCVILHGYERICINWVAWRGEDMTLYGGDVAKEDEMDLTVWKPSALGRPCAIFGGLVVVHFSFGPQSRHMTKTGYLEMYRRKAYGLPHSLVPREWNTVEKVTKPAEPVTSTDAPIRFVKKHAGSDTHWRYKSSMTRTAAASPIIVFQQDALTPSGDIVLASPRQGVLVL